MTERGLRMTTKSERGLEATDDMPAGLRQCVHEYGFAIVNACLQFGVRKPAHIRQLVREIWAGARQPAQRATIGNRLDWLLMQAGSDLSAATLVRMLWSDSFVIAPLSPSALMTAASMATVSGHDVLVTKQQKHQMRLRAALFAARHMWPSLKDLP